jgi:hypothetical protein
VKYLLHSFELFLLFATIEQKGWLQLLYHEGGIFFSCCTENSFSIQIALHHHAAEIAKSCRVLDNQVIVSNTKVVTSKHD